MLSKLKSILLYAMVALVATASVVIISVPFKQLQLYTCQYTDSCMVELEPEVEQQLPSYEDWQCLRQALFFEIRNGNKQAMQNVADVIINRVAARGFPSTVCKVVQQPWQFSYLNKGKPTLDWDEYLSYADAQALEQINKIAFDTLVHGSNNQQILWYHTHAVKPSWSKRLKQDVQDKYHRFFTHKTKE